MRRDQSAGRVAALRGRLVDLELDGVVITTPENIRYLSGFSGSLGYLVIGRTDAEILGDSRYWLQMEAEAPGFTLVRSGPSHGLWALVAERLKALKLRRVGFESQHLTFDQHQRLSSALPGEHALVAIAGLVEELPIVKAPEEVELLRAVAAIAGRASDRVLERGDMVVVDFGATAAGYHSDTTRTIVVGEPSPDQARVIEAVRQAQLESMALMKPGVAADAVDRRAREVLAGETHAFGHGLGHGIGLQVHERPFLSPTDHTPLRAGMVITNEPGIYIPGWGGVRLEEMVLITETGPEVLTSASWEIGVG